MVSTLKRTVFARQERFLRAAFRKVHNRRDSRKKVLDRSTRITHFFLYLIAGAAMGGFLDVTAFGESTPVYGMVFGAIVAVLYQAVFWIRERK